MRSIIFAVALLVTGTAHAQQLKTALERAWQLSERGRHIEARTVELDARLAQTRTWFAGAPTLELDLRRDTAGTVNGATEWESAVAMPLWLAGQRDAQRREIEAQRAALAADEAHERLSLAGALREAAWAFALATATLHAQTERLQSAQALEADVARRVKAGDLARADLLLAQDEKFSAAAAQSSAQAGLRAATEHYRALVGEVPADSLSEEPAASQAAIDHPELQAARQRVNLLRAQLAAANLVHHHNPTLIAGARFERGVGAEPNRQGVRVGVSIPFPGDVRSAPRVAAARSEQVDAEITLARLERDLASRERIARGNHEASLALLDSTQERRRVTQEALVLAERAFALGAKSLPELIRLRSRAMEADLASRSAQLERGLARARLNQSIGVLP